jgi:WD40 repeat protein
MKPLSSEDPRHVGGFRLLGRLGEGGMGLVFLGATPGGRKVVVKLIRPEYADDPDFRLRFAREVAAARKVGGFHTAQVLAADTDAHPPWMATAYIAGLSLAAAVEEGGPLRPEVVRELGAALAEGVKAIHDCGLIHRDLKPTNIIMAADGPRIIDFGIAKGAGTTAITAGRAIGTFQYMSPEHLGAGGIAPASDVFSLGAVLAFAATGHVPFDGDGFPAITKRILYDPPALAPLAGPLRDVISACLAKDPAGRPSLDELVGLLASQETSPADPASQDLAPASTQEAPAPLGGCAGVTTLSTITQIPKPYPGDDFPVSADVGVPVRPTPSAAAQGLAPKLVPAAPPLVAHADDVTRVSFSSDGRFLATAAADLTVCLWDTATWRPIVPPVPLSLLPADVKKSPFGRQLIFAPDCRSVLGVRYGYSAIWQWDTVSGQLVGGSPLALETLELGRPQLRYSPPPLSLSPDGRFALRCLGQSLQLWDISVGQPAELGAGVLERGGSWLGGGLYSSFSSDGRLAAAIDGRGQIHLWDTATRERAGLLREPRRRPSAGILQIRELAISKSMVAAASKDQYGFSGVLYEWDMNDRRPRPHCLEKDYEGSELALSPDGRFLAASYRSSVRLWDTATRTSTDMQYIHDYRSGRGPFHPSRLMFSPNGEWVMARSGRDDGELAVWYTDGRQSSPAGARYAEPGTQVGDIAFSPDSQLIATAEGKTARVWLLDAPPPIA